MIYSGRGSTKQSVMLGLAIDWLIRIAIFRHIVRNLWKIAPGDI
jgi:hypothetical protein